MDASVSVWAAAVLDEGHPALDTLTQQCRFECIHFLKATCHIPVTPTVLPGCHHRTFWVLNWANQLMGRIDLSRGIVIIVYFIRGLCCIWSLCKICSVFCLCKGAHLAVVALAHDAVCMFYSFSFLLKSNDVWVVREANWQLLVIFFSQCTW